MQKDSKEINIIDAVRDTPIEGMMERIRDDIFSTLKDEPCTENMVSLAVLETAADRALECILKEDAIYRPASEWLPALEKVEQIRDDAHDLLDDLKKILY